MSDLTMDKTPPYGTIEWFKWHAKYDTRWLGENSEVLLKLYEALEKRLAVVLAENAGLEDRLASAEALVEAFRQEKIALHERATTAEADVADLRENRETVALVAALRKRLDAVKAMADKVIAEVEGDERYHYPAANVQVNAPLALIQCVMKGQLMAAKRIQAAARAEEKDDGGQS